MLDLASTLPSTPGPWLLGVGALALIACLLSLVVDTVKYRKIPSLDVPLREGSAYGGYRANMC